MDSGASTSLISMDLLPGVEHKSKAVGTINGIGGKQIVGEPLKCDIVFRSGLEASHGLKPTNFPNNPGLVILGTDFMEKFGATKFDWDKGVIKLGDDWVYCTMENKLDCTFGPELSNDERKMDKLVDNVKKKMVLRTMPDEAGVGAFIDNVFIFSETFEDHIKWPSCGVMNKTKHLSC